MTQPTAAEANQAWRDMVGPHGPAVQLALATLRDVPDEVIANAIDEIDSAVAIGPLLDPSAWIDGRRFTNAVGWLDTLRAIQSLKATIKKTPTTGGVGAGDPRP